MLPLKMVFNCRSEGGQTLTMQMRKRGECSLRQYVSGPRVEKELGMLQKLSGWNTERLRVGMGWRLLPNGTGEVQQSQKLLQAQTLARPPPGSERPSSRDPRREVILWW